MKVKVILLDTIRGVGKKDEIIEVKDGYANNFLYPQNKAVPATTENLNKLKNKNERALKNLEKEIEIAKKISTENQENKIIINVKAVTKGKLYVSIGAKKISDSK